MEEEFKKLLEVYQESGIVTRIDVGTMDNRSGSRELYRRLMKNGYEEALIIEVNRDNYSDYSSVIFNTDRFTLSEAEEYMLKYVLIKLT